jgi:hypothetical protein
MSSAVDTRIATAVRVAGYSSEVEDTDAAVFIVVFSVLWHMGKLQSNGSVGINPSTIKT